MKATVTEIKRFAVHDGDGIRTTVFLKGCPLRCVWCHNPEGLSAKKQLAFYKHKCTSCGTCRGICSAHLFDNGKHIFDRSKCISCGRCIEKCSNDALKLYGKEMTAEEALSLILEDKAFYESSGGGVTLSGGECLTYPSFCAELLRLCKENGINTAVDTCGYVSKEALDAVIPYTDIFLYDIKAIDENVHIKCTGVSNKIILDNLRYLDSLGCKTEIRTPCVAGYNSDELQRIKTFVSGLKNVTKHKILPYNSFARSKYEALGLKYTEIGE